MKNLTFKNVEIMKDMIEDLVAYHKLVVYIGNYSSNPESTIIAIYDDSKLKAYTEPFEKYKLGLKGINTKDTTIALALEELYKISDKIYEDVMKKIKELKELKDDVDIKDHLKALEDSLNVVSVDRCFKLTKTDKVIETYANSNIIKELGKVFGPSLTTSGYVAHLISTSMQVKEYVDKLQINNTICFNNSIPNTLVYLDIVKEDIVKGRCTVSMEPFELQAIPEFNLVPIKDKVTDYIILKEISTSDSNLTPIAAIIKLYKTTQYAEAKIISLVEKLKNLDPSAIAYTVTALHDYIASLHDNDDTTDDIKQKSTKFIYLINNAVNKFNQVMVDNNTKLSEVNSIINFLYLLKSIIESVVIMSTIKEV